MVRTSSVAEHEVEAAPMEQSRATVRGRNRLADATPDGRVLADVEGEAVGRGLRSVLGRLRDVVDARAAAPEKKGRGWDGPCSSRCRNGGRADRRPLTAAGDVPLSRFDPTCRDGGRHAHPLDDRLGLDRFVGPHAQRLLGTPRADRPFEKSARRLRDAPGTPVCDDTVRAACDRHGGLMRASHRENSEAARPFRDAGFRPTAPASTPPAGGARSGPGSSPGGAGASP